MFDDQEARAIMIKQSRRMLMASLKLFYPTAQLFPAICMTVPEVEKHHLKIDIAYLIEKGCVACVNEKPNISMDERKFKITAIGLEVLDGLKDDPALQL